MCQKHKCVSKNCKNMISQEETWCELCLEEFGKLLKKHPHGFVPMIFDPNN